MYTSVTPVQIKEMILAKTLTEMRAIKDKDVMAVQLTAKLAAHMAMHGYQTVVMDENGEPLVETTNKKIVEGDWLVTNILAGYKNSYVISHEKFIKFYKSTDNEQIYTPISGVRTVYQLTKGINLEFVAPWGDLMKVREGGVLVAEGEEFYGINPEEFKATYSVV